MITQEGVGSVAAFFLCTFFCFFAGAYVGSSNLFTRNRRKGQNFARVEEGQGSRLCGAKEEEDLRRLAAAFALQQQQQQRNAQKQALALQRQGTRKRAQNANRDCHVPAFEQDDSSDSFTHSEAERVFSGTLQRAFTPPEAPGGRSKFAQVVRESPRKLLRATGQQQRTFRAQKERPAQRYVLSDDSQDLAAVLQIMSGLAGEETN